MKNNIKILLSHNIISVVLIAVSIVMYVYSEDLDMALLRQESLIEQVSFMSNSSNYSSDGKDQLMKVLSSSFKAQQSANLFVSTVANLLLILGLVNIFITMVTIKKWKV